MANPFSKQGIRQGITCLSVRTIFLVLLVSLVSVSVSKAERTFFSYSLPDTGDGRFGFGKSAAFGDFQDGNGPVLVVGAPLKNNSDGGMFALYGPNFGLPSAVARLKDSTQIHGSLGQSVAFIPSFLKVNGEGFPVFVGGAPTHNGGEPGGPIIHDSGSVFQYHHAGSGLLEVGIAPLLEIQSNDVGYDVVSCDFNGDGYTDIAVGCNQTSAALGEVYVYLGGDESGNSFLIKPNDPNLTNPQFGMSIADAGTLDDNDSHELLISHQYEGKAYIVYGRPHQGSGTSIISIWETGNGSSNGVTAISARRCQTVAGGHDITGDSQKDIVITYIPTSNGRQQINIYSGPDAAGDEPDLVSSILGGASFGDVLALGGDVNGDGISDLLVGCPTGQPSDGENIYNRGVIAAFLGGDLPGYLDIGSNYVTLPDIWFVSPIEELTGYENFGSTVGFMDDQDNDGIVDIFVGASHMTKPSGFQKGKIYGYSLPKSDKISLTNLTPTILANGVEASTLFTVEASHVSALQFEITMTAPEFFADPVVLVDNEDGTYSHSEPGLDVPPGEYDVEFFAVSSWEQAVGGDGAFLLKKDTISAVSNNVVYSKPDTGVDTGLSYLGTPYSSVAWNFNNDQYKDLFITISDDVSVLNSGIPGHPTGEPEFNSVHPGLFGSSPPQPGLLGAAVGDLDFNDDYTDLFAAHATDSRLYRWDGTNFDNYAPAAGVDDFDDAISGSWGDLNGDGHLDLFITRAELYTEDPPNYGSPKSTLGSLVLTNVDDGSGGRSFSTSPGSGLPASLYGTNATWCDFDEDGDSDLFVGALTMAGAGASKLFLNDGGVLSDQTAALLGSTSLVLVVGSAWEDMNSDGKFDLVLVRHGDQPLVYFQDVAGGFGDGAGGAGPMAFGPSHGFSSMVLFDYNNDGYRDFLGLSNDSTRAPQLFQNISGISEPSFVELPVSIGLDDVGYVHGAVAADFGGPSGQLDGLTDLYLGRPIVSGAFYFKCEPNQPAQADFHYTGVRLIGPEGLANKSGIGAEVKIERDGLAQIQVVDGGSMRGSQSYSDLMFGLGEGTGSFTATITWPNGVVQDNFVPPLVLDDINVIQYPVPTVINSSVTAKYVAKAGGLVDWVFTWETDIPSVQSVDEVHFSMSSIPQQCLPDYPSITEAIPGVTVSQTANTGGGYTHVMTWAGRDCEPNCIIPFFVESGYLGQTDVSDTAVNLRVKICAGF